jgi:N-acetylmuramoyl-L-alanine amidase
MRFPVYWLFITLWVVIFVFPLVTLSQPTNELHQLRTVIIDPGHGGSDPGAIAGEVNEKNLVLSVALRLGNKIKYGFPDVKVIYTRSKDVFVPLHERASIAIKNKADVFISVHANFVSQPSVRGTETFTLGLHRSQENLEVAKKENSVILLEENYTSNYQGFNPNEPESYIMFENMQSEYQSQSIELAANIQDEFTRNLRSFNRGVKQAGFLVLRQTSMPSVLIEIGFISNPDERKFLTSEFGKEKVSESIFQAFSAYKKMIDQKSRFEVASVEQTPDIPEFQDTIKNRNQTTHDPEITGNSVEHSQESDSVIIQNKDIITKTDQVANSGNQNSKVYYSVQIGALNDELEPSPVNFKGEKNIFRVYVKPYFKFFSGKFDTFGEAFNEKSRLGNKFPGAFVVIFENSVPRVFKKEIRNN